MTSRGILLRAPYADLGALARRAETAGFQAVWVGEATQSATVQAAVIALATTSIQIGTNVTLAFPRSPVVTAMEAWDLNELVGDRFVVGLGSQVRRIVEERFASDFDRPVERMAEYVQAMRAAWEMDRGRTDPYVGRHYHVLRPGLGGFRDESSRPLPAVHIAAVGPRMTSAAVQHGDGWLGHPLTSHRYLTETALPRIHTELDARRRDQASFRICQNIICSISDDREMALRDAKHQIAFYATTPNYKRVLEASGDEWLTDELRRVWRETSQDIDALIDVVPDEVAHRYAVVGTPDEVRGLLPTIESLVDHTILSGPRYQVPPSRISDNLSAMIETLGSTSTGGKP